MSKKNVIFSKENTDKSHQALTSKFVQSHYSSHSKSSLPHILAEYGMEEQQKPILKVRTRKNQFKYNWYITIESVVICVEPEYGDLFLSVQEMITLYPLSTHHQSLDHHDLFLIADVVLWLATFTVNFCKCFCLLVLCGLTVNQNPLESHVYNFLNSINRSMFFTEREKTSKEK